MDGLSPIAGWFNMENPLKMDDFPQGLDGFTREDPKIK